jgi:hypothetical protein
MLMGIRDTLLGRKSWTFLQGDIRFKRIQLANEVLHESIMFGNPSLAWFLSKFILIIIGICNKKAFLKIKKILIYELNKQIIKERNHLFPNENVVLCESQENYFYVQVKKSDHKKCWFYRYFSVDPIAKTSRIDWFLRDLNIELLNCHLQISSH